MKDYDEDEWLTRYLFKNYSHLLSRVELQARRVLFHRAKAEGCPTDSPVRQHHEAEAAKLFAKSSVQKLLVDGPQAFHTAAAQRLLRKRSRAIDLNRCPTCSRIPRTPKAKQCPWCFARWD